MALILLSLLCLAGAAMSKVSEKDFLILNEGTYANDLELDLMENLEKNDTTKIYLTELLKMDSASNLREACVSSSGCPQVYLEALDSGLKVFEEDSSINPVIRIDSEEGTPKPKYSCKSTIKLLKHLYLRATNEICFVPFPNTQSLTFAMCELNGKCWRSSDLEMTPSGNCRPSCFARRRLQVICMKIGRPWNANWKSLLVNLPQYCSCSA